MKHLLLTIGILCRIALSSCIAQDPGGQQPSSGPGVQQPSNNRNLDLGFYTNLLTKAGDKDNFIGADVATQWYRRNINMFSLIQKSITEKDQKIMILLGASHIAVLEKLFELNPEYSIVELKDVLKK